MQRISSLEKPAVATNPGAEPTAPPDHTPIFARILARARTQLLQPAPLAAAAVLILAVLGVIVLKHAFGIDLTTKEGLKLAIHSAGMWAMLCFVLILALSVVVSYLPGVPLAAIAGMTWGGLVGGALVVAGGTLGALIAYMIGRYLGSSAVAALAGARIRPREGVGQRSLTVLVLVSRLIPLIPFDIVSYGAGARGAPSMCPGLPGSVALYLDQRDLLSDPANHLHTSDSVFTGSSTVRNRGTFDITLKKTGSSNRTQAVAWAFEAGLIKSPAESDAEPTESGDAPPLVSSLPRLSDPSKLELEGLAIALIASLQRALADPEAWDGTLADFGRVFDSHIPMITWAHIPSRGKLTVTRAPAMGGDWQRRFDEYYAALNPFYETLLRLPVDFFAATEDYPLGAEFYTSPPGVLSEPRY